MALALMVQGDNVKKKLLNAILKELRFLALLSKRLAVVFISILLLFTYYTRKRNGCS